MDKVAAIIGKCCVDKQFRDGLKEALKERRSFSALEPFELTNRECEKIRCLFDVLKNHEAKFGDIQAAISDSWNTIKCSYSEDDCCDVPPC